MHKSNVIIKQVPSIKYIESSLLRRAMNKITEEEEKERITFNGILIDNKEIRSISYQIDTDMLTKNMQLTRIILWTNGTITNDIINI